MISWQTSGVLKLSLELADDNIRDPVRVHTEQIQLPG